MNVKWNLLNTEEKLTLHSLLPQFGTEFGHQTRSRRSEKLQLKTPSTHANTSRELRSQFIQQIEAQSWDTVP